MKKETEKTNYPREISPILRGMKLGEHQAYPSERYTSVANTIFRIQKELRRLRRRYTLRRISDSEIEVTRIG